VLCEGCHPIFGVGYDINRESAEEDERETIEAPLYEGRLPDETAWRSLMYIGARFVNNDFILSRLAEPRRWLKWMKDGGLFIHTPYGEYAYENAEAYRHVEQGKTAKKQGEFALTIQHYQRAQGIFRSVSNELEACIEATLGRFPNKCLIQGSIQTVSVKKVVYWVKDHANASQDNLSIIVKLLATNYFCGEAVLVRSNACLRTLGETPCSMRSAESHLQERQLF